MPKCDIHAMCVTVSGEPTPDIGPHHIVGQCVRCGEWLHIKDGRVRLAREAEVPAPILGERRLFNGKWLTRVKWGESPEKD